MTARQRFAVGLSMRRAAAFESTVASAPAQSRAGCGRRAPPGPPRPRAPAHWRASHIAAPPHDFRRAGPRDADRAGQGHGSRDARASHCRPRPRPRSPESCADCAFRSLVIGSCPMRRLASAECLAAARASPVPTAIMPRDRAWNPFSRLRARAPIETSEGTRKTKRSTPHTIASAIASASTAPSANMSETSYSWPRQVRSTTPGLFANQVRPKRRAPAPRGKSAGEPWRLRSKRQAHGRKPPGRQPQSHGFAPPASCSVAASRIECSAASAACLARASAGQSPAA